ncbi:MAG: DUF1211 domain-containing protein [Caulobacter sp.]|jgi:hypothetical protein|nr:DUF1211 domain-containing protein [Caulobacter sp.]
MAGDEGRDREAGKRLDAFVDAAFAFAVSLLIIASADRTTSIDALWDAMGRIPASLGAFALIVMFWLAYRQFGRLAPRRDTLTTLNALAIVFTVLVYVFPLRMLVESGFVWASRGWLSGDEMIRTLGDLRDLFRIYGVGFAVLAGLFASLYLRALRHPDRLGVAPADRAEVRTSFEIWTLSGGAGLLSAALTFGPMAKAPWLPGMAYWVIPLAISARKPLGRLLARKPAPGGAAP